MTRDQNKTLKRYQAAKSRREGWDALLDEAYRFAVPNHDPRGTSRPGDKRGADIFDGTATDAINQRVARLHGQLFPPFRPWMDFEPDGKIDEQQWGGRSDSASEVFHRAIEASNFHVEIPGPLTDSCISTGMILVHEGDLDAPIRFEAVPISQFVPEEGPDGLIRTVFRPWSVSGRNLLVKWPDAKLPGEVSREIDEKPEATFSVIEAFLHNAQTGGCDYECYLERDVSGRYAEGKIVERRYRTSPAVVFRQGKAPGEWMGRGDVLTVLPDIKTLNKVVELTLKNAAIAVTGIWQAEDDGVLNPANIKLVPGAIIPKAVNSAGLTPLQPAGRFDVSQLLSADLQERVRRAILGPSLPPADQSARTAFEIDLRRSEQQAVEVPRGLRLLAELVSPLAARIVSVLSSEKFIGSEWHIAPLELEDGRHIRPKPRNPLIRLQDAADAAQSYQAYMAGLQAFPDVVPGLVNRSGYAGAFLKDNGFPDDMLAGRDAQAEFEAAVRLKMAGTVAALRFEQQGPEQQEAEQQEADHAELVA